MFSNLGVTEILIIAVVLILLFGAKKIPELAQGIGKGLKEFKKSVKDTDEDSSKNDNKTNTK
ncbi:MAG: twin-arginine translocase TatA/TatE family subunit [Ignavibacteriaceae bacterium]